MDHHGTNKYINFSTKTDSLKWGLYYEVTNLLKVKSSKFLVKKLFVST